MTIETCPGPGPMKGEKCGRPIAAGEHCVSHRQQLRAADFDESALRPLLGPHGKRYEDAVRLELRNVPPEVIATLAALGEKVPPTDKRQEVPAYRGARYLVTAYAQGGAKFYASHDPAKAKISAPLAQYGKAIAGRVDLRKVPRHEAEALEALGAKILPARKLDQNLALRGVRWLVQAYHDGGLRLLSSHMPKDLTPPRQSA